MAHAKNHDYHVLPPSIWPFVGAISAFIMLTGAVSGKRLKNTESGLLGAWIRLLMNIKGMTNGMITTVVV